MPCGAFFKIIKMRIFDFLREVKLEMGRVNWPTKSQVVKYTWVVVLMSIILAVFLGGLDLIFTYLLSRLL